MPLSEPADPPRTQRDSQPSISPIDLDHGVAVGDVTSRTAVVWMRADETAVVHLEYGPVDRAAEPGLTDVSPPLVADGGTNWRDLNAFQRDVLLAIADLGDGQPYDRQIKRRLEEEFGEPVVESRLYQALNALVDWTSSESATAPSTRGRSTTR